MTLGKNRQTDPLLINKKKYGYILFLFYSKNAKNSTADKITKVSAKTPTPSDAYAWDKIFIFKTWKTVKTLKTTVQPR